ncbi:ArdC family protein [Algoriphagus persicinus]|uniref:ArdC family protein n=1 Tax=Algoriphagus persicinus TaxID=3108754 RepID=UPI002B3AAF2D|nr:ArdC family protein [Algoriphagus sp. E1-3-M2]MEB2786368.1 ArdC family protein [Algoriphagus sp. E1-3-M2]
MKNEAKTSTKRQRGSAFQNYGGSSDIYGKFTDLIIEKLEQGVIPWKQPWHEMGLPANYLTKKPYKGINLWLLLSSGQTPYGELVARNTRVGCKFRSRTIRQIIQQIMQVSLARCSQGFFNITSDARLYFFKMLHYIKFIQSGMNSCNGVMD